MNMNKRKMHRLQLQDHSFLRQVSGNNPLVAGLTNFGTESTGLNRKLAATLRTLRGSRPGVQSASLIMMSLMTS